MNDVVISLLAPTFDKAAQGLAGEGRRLADSLGARLHAIVLGKATPDLTANLSRLADTLTVVDQVELSTYQPETYLAVLVQLFQTLPARTLLLGNDTYSQELAPRLAHRLGGSAVGDAVELRV